MSAGGDSNYFGLSRFVGDDLGCISMSGRAKHFGRQFINDRQRFTAEMLRPTNIFAFIPDAPRKLYRQQIYRTKPT